MGVGFEKHVNWQRITDHSWKKRWKKTLGAGHEQDVTRHWVGGELGQPRRAQVFAVAGRTVRNRITGPCVGVPLAAVGVRAVGGVVGVRVAGVDRPCPGAAVTDAACMAVAEAVYAGEVGRCSGYRVVASMAMLPVPSVRWQWRRPESLQRFFRQVRR